MFPETFVPAYPSSVWAKALAGWAEPGAKEAFALLAREAVAVPGAAEARIGAAAREHGVWIVTGVNEVDPARPSTLYNTLLFHAPDGTLASKHRKLVPTNHERLVWGQGDGGGLRAIPTPLGRLGGLICWENYMPLARFALYESGVEIYVASTADDGDAWQATLVHIARESRAFVVSPAHFQRESAYPVDFPLRGWSRARARSAAAARRSSLPAGLTSPDRSTTRKGSSTPSSIRQSCGPSGSGSTRQATTTAPTCSSSPSPRTRSEQRRRRRLRRLRRVDRARARRRGWDVTVVEQYAPGNVRSGSGGDTRLLRFSHGDQDWYTLSARRSLELWHELERESGRAALRARGHRLVRDATDTFTARSEAALNRLGIACERLSPAEARRLYPSLGADDLESVLLEPEAGVLYARAATARSRRRSGSRPDDPPPKTPHGPTSSSGPAARGCRGCSRSWSRSGSRGAMSSSSASAVSGPARPASASTRAPTTDMASSAASE